MVSKLGSNGDIVPAKNAGKLKRRIYRKMKLLEEMRT